MRDKSEEVRVVRRSVAVHPLRGIHWVPRIVHRGDDYDPHLEEFLLAMPTLGVRSRHSMRAYATDVAIWLRFLNARGKRVWDVGRDDVLAFHWARRSDDAAFSVSAKSWNRSIAVLDKLYCWGLERELIARNPLPKKQGWVRRGGDLRPSLSDRNLAYEQGQQTDTIKSITLAEYRMFRGAGLLGLQADGRPRLRDRSRNGWRNVLFADLMVTTGLRLEECAGLLAAEAERALGLRGERQVQFRLPRNLTKGNTGRTIRIPRRLLESIHSYVSLERENAVAKFQEREGWKKIERPIWTTAVTERAARVQLSDGSWQWLHLDKFSPIARLSLVKCTDDLTPIEPASLWLSETGIPIKPNTWEVAFRRACSRAREAGLQAEITPHVLRHTFAIYMLALLTGATARAAAGPDLGPGDEVYRRLMLDPLRELQKLLGHRRLETTYLYLEHLGSLSAPADDAMQQLLNLVSEEELVRGD